MVRTSSVAISVALAAALGIGAYVIAKHNADTPQLAQTAAPGVVASTSASPFPEASAPPPNAVARAAANNLIYPTTATVAVAPGATSALPAASSSSYSSVARSQSSDVSPFSQPAPATATSTVTETTTTTHNQALHRGYVRHRVAHHHKRGDKIHVARATKHTLNFALKMPGRLSM